MFVRSGKQLKLWAFTIAGFLLVAVAIAVFARVTFWRSDDHYQVLFSRSVTGLSVGARVERWGLPIGRVESIRFSGERPDAPIMVDIAVDSGAYIPAGVRASLEIEGLTFIKYIDLVGGEIGERGLEPGAEIPGTAGGLAVVLEETGPMIETLGDVLDKADRIATDVLEITGEAEGQRITSILDDAERAASSAAEAAVDIRAVTSRLRAGATGGGRGARDQSDLGAAMADVRQAAREFRKAATDLTTLTRRTGRSLDLLFSRLRSTTTSVQNLVRSLEENPSRLLRGKPPPERRIP